MFKSRLIALLFLLCLGAPAHAVIAHVQHAESQNGGASTTQATTLTGTTIHNFIAVGVFWCGNAACNGTGGVVTGVVSSAGETCAQSPSSAATSTSGLFGDIWYCTDIHGGSDTITVTVSNGAGATNFLAVLLSEWSGVATTSPLDNVGNNTGNTAGTTTISVATSASTAVAGELIFSIAAAFNPIVTTNTALNVGINTVEDGYQIAGAPAVYTNGFNMPSGGGDKLAGIAAFKPAAAGGGSAGFRSMMGVGK